MINYDQAVAILQSQRFALGEESLALGQCTGRILGADLPAKVASPPYTNSAMDGFAVRRQEALGGPLRIVGEVYARPLRPEDVTLPEPRACVRIMTGGFLPEWADTVIPVEQSKVNTVGEVSFSAVPELGTNIRRQGEDLRAGDLVLRRGTKLDAERIMLAAAFGYAAVPVTQRPRIFLCATGDELVEPGLNLAPGAVYNSSKYFLLAAMAQLGLPVDPTRDFQTLADDPARAEQLLRQLSADGQPLLIISTGAVSAGEADFIPKLGERLGLTALFHRVAIRPGKPVYFARSENLMWLGLPGNPISTCTGWQLFARPLLTAVCGMATPERRTLVLQNEVRKPEGLRCFFRAEVSGDRAFVAQKQGSAQFAASISSKAYVDLPAGLSRIPAETRVEAIII